MKISLETEPQGLFILDLKYKSSNDENLSGNRAKRLIYIRPKI